MKAARDPVVRARFSEVRRADLLPFLFKLHGNPYSLTNHIQLREFFDAEYARKTILLCGRQVGKTNSVYHLMPDDLHSLRKSNGSPLTKDDLVEGTEIVALDGKWRTHAAKISKVWKDYTKFCIRVKTRLGRTITCSREHRVLTYSGYVEAGTLSVGDRLVVAVKGGEFGSAKADPRRVSITAYMIGDGSCSSKRFVSVTSGCDAVTEDILGMFPDAHVCRKRGTDAVAILFRRNSNVVRWLEEDGTLGHHSWNKALPGWVYDLDRESTTLFISKLWATDGSIRSYRGFPSITYSTASTALACGLRSIIMKYGILTSLRSKATRCNGKRCRTAYEIRVEGPDSQRRFCETFDVPGKPPVFPKTAYTRSNRTTLPIECNGIIRRMLAPYTGNRGNSLRTHGFRAKLKYPPSVSKVEAYLGLARRLGLSKTEEYRQLDDLVHGDVVFDAITSIEDVGVVEGFDVEVGVYNNLVLDGVVVHNSQSLSYSEILDSVTTPNFQTLYVAPLQSQAQRYSTLYIKEAITSCPFAVKLQEKELEGVLSDTKIMRAVGHQSFANGAGLQLMYAKTSPDRARGIMADRIDFDEVQDQLFDTVPIISESLTASKYGITKFTGTAKTLDNTIERLWQQSSMNEWIMKCPHCGYENIPTKDGGIADMPQPDGMHCVNPRCRMLLDVRRGRWVPFHPDRDNSFRGYHIPQVVLPFIVENRGRWGLIWNKILKYPPELIMQECFGISESSGARIIDETHIRRQSTLPTMQYLREHLDRYVARFSGVDWGGAEESSFTVHVIVGIRPDGRTDVIYAKRYHAYDPDLMYVNIAKAHTLYRCGAMAADYGLGFQNNLIMMHRFGIPVVQMNFVRQNTPLKFSTTNRGDDRWSIDKTQALRATFLAIKYGRVYFPPYLEFKPYTDDLLSPYEHVVETSGLTNIVYMRDPARPDDFAMALCFVLMMAVRMAGLDILDLIPKTAFSGGNASGSPDDSVVDPNDYVARE